MEYVRISRYESGELLGSYVQPIWELVNAIDGELDGPLDVGTKLMIEVINMSDEEYKQLPEFKGY